MYTLFLLTVSFLISLILMPIFIWGSRKFGFVDYPNSRKVHLKPIPYLGGVAILISFAIGVLISRPIEAEYKAIILGGIEAHLSPPSSWLFINLAFCLLFLNWLKVLWVHLEEFIMHLLLLV